MTISKVSPLVCLLAAGVACSAVHAEDNPAQAAARIALAKALFDANSQPATNALAVAPAPAAPAAPVPAAPAPAPAAPAQAPAAPAPAAPAEASAPAQPVAVQADATQSSATGDNAAQAAARAALARKLFEGSDSAPAAPAAQPATAQPAAVQPVAAQPAAVQPAAQPVVTESPVAGDNPAQAAARDALAKKLFDLNPEQPAPASNTGPVSTVVVKTAEPSLAPAPVMAPAPTAAYSGDSYYVGKELGLKPISTPALPISGSKEQRLQVLLNQYKADQITPQEYHQQRAAILAEP